MSHSRRPSALVILIAITFAAATALSADSPPAVRIAGDVSAPGDWTVSRIRAELASAIQPVKFTSHGQSHLSNCLPLLAILKAAGVQTELKMDPKADPKIKNYELRLAVVVQGRDGYVVTFSLSELLADVGNRPAWLALDEDGQPLSAREEPLKLIVPDDQKPARWVRAVQSITVINGAAPTTQAAG
jgi:hypothetical protein